MATNIASISSRINDMFSFSRKPAPQVPGPLISIGGKQKPSLSTIQSAMNVIEELKKHGIPTDAMPDGSENKTMAFLIAIFDEIYRALREDANIQVAYGPGAITLMTTGANSGGPMISQGINTNFAKGEAIIQ